VKVILWEGASMQKPSPNNAMNFFCIMSWTMYKQDESLFHQINTVKLASCEFDYKTILLWFELLALL
jgi:hypothetical protein